jgi:SAM-dependent methyltransferase
VSGFSADWLALREPFDAAARADALVAELLPHLQREAPLEVLDLGAGTGSNLRHLAPLIGGAQRWRLADHDPRLLAAALATTHAWADERGARAKRDGYGLTISGEPALEVALEPVDLAELAAVDLPAGCLVTAAALLDLVSHAWLDELARHCSAARAAVCFALSYDGRTTITPAEPEDGDVLELFNRHQLGDKGFGSALGPGAAAAAEAAFSAVGYEVRFARSDWVVDTHAHALQLALLDGWRDAATEAAPERRAALASWHERRSTHVAAGRSTLAVGHVDLVGWPRHTPESVQPTALHIVPVHAYA